MTTVLCRPEPGEAERETIMLAQPGCGKASSSKVRKRCEPGGSEQPDLMERIEIPLSTKDQFAKIAEQYPLVKELKDRLRLDIDFK